jgi:hypothetical protein
MAEDKFRRNYDASRGYLDQIDELGPNPVLNTIYNVYPVEADTADMQRKIRDAFAAHRKPLSMFDVNLGRLYQRSKFHKVALCSMPKSGSTFILSSLARLKAQKFSGVFLHTPYLNPDFVGALACEHEIDELSLLFLETRQHHWVSHMHTKWTPYTELVFRSHGIRPIITYRNIFDCIVSMDDMLMKREVAGFSMLRLPKRYHDMPVDDRLMLLCQFAGPWYVDFVVSWSRVQLPVLRLYYDEDIRGFSDETAARLRSYLKLDEVDEQEFRAAFNLVDDGARGRARFNKGVSGRGEAIPQAGRDHIIALTKAFEGEVDFSAVL